MQGKTVSHCPGTFQHRRSGHLAQHSSSMHSSPSLKTRHVLSQELCPDLSRKALSGPKGCQEMPAIRQYEGLQFTAPASVLSLNYLLYIICSCNYSLHWTTGHTRTTKLPCASRLPEALGWDYSNHRKDACKDFGQRQLSVSQSPPGRVQESGLQAAALLSGTESGARAGTSYSWPGTQSACGRFQHAALTSTEVTTEASTKAIWNNLCRSRNPQAWHKTSVVNAEGMEGPQVSSPGCVGFIFFSSLALSCITSKCSNGSQCICKIVLFC